MSDGGWNGTYRVINPIPNSTFRGGAGAFPQVGLEDTYMWHDPRGNFHALFHAFGDGCSPSCKNDVGGHAFSRDGASWTYASKEFGFAQNGAYDLNVTLRNGSVVELFRRERPHLLLDKAGNPEYLTNGVQACPYDNQNGADWTYTGAFPIRKKK